MTYRNDTAATEQPARGPFQESQHPDSRSTRSGRAGQGHQPRVWIGQARALASHRGGKPRQHVCSFKLSLHYVSFPTSCCLLFHPPFPKLSPSAPQLYIWALRKAPSEPVQATLHGYNHPVAQCQQSVCSGFGS